MTRTIMAGLLAGYGLALPLGAVAVMMVNHTARTSFSMGVAAAGGAVTADACYAVASLAVGGALASAIQPWSATIEIACALLLLAMAAQIVRRAVRPQNPRSRLASPTTHVSTYLTYAALTALNPWPLVYFTALMLERPTRTADISLAALYTGAIVIASASWQLVLAAVGATLGQVLTGRRARVATSVIAGLLIGALAIDMLARA